MWKSGYSYSFYCVRDGKNENGSWYVLEIASHLVVVYVFVYGVVCIKKCILQL